MTATINYDRHVENLIDELSATGHVTHTKYKKKSVTLHHNGGVRFSHQTILNIWRTRPASAHFDVDASGSVAQYVDVHEYAWAVGNTQGNCETISIEMADISGSPNWQVADATWRSAARLAGWLFAHVIGTRPTTANFFLHQHWSATACPGPFVKNNYGRILRAAQAAYDQYHAPAPTLTKVQHFQQMIEVPTNNRWDHVTDHRAIVMRNASRAHSGYPHNVPTVVDVRTVQEIVDTKPDGVWGPNTQAALVTWIKGLQRLLGVGDDGKWGPGTDSAFLVFRRNHLT